MGINLMIYIKKEHLPRLIDNFEDFMFLVDKGMWRWYLFQQHLGIKSERVTAKELLSAIASTNRRIKDRETWARLCESYDLIFQPEGREAPEGYVEVYDVYLKIIEFVKHNMEQIIGGG